MVSCCFFLTALLIEDRIVEISRHASWLSVTEMWQVQCLTDRVSLFESFGPPALGSASFVKIDVEIAVEIAVKNRCGLLFNALILSRISRQANQYVYCMCMCRMRWVSERSAMVTASHCVLWLLLAAALWFDSLILCHLLFHSLDTVVINLRHSGILCYIGLYTADTL